MSGGSPFVLLFHSEKKSGLGRRLLKDRGKQTRPKKEAFVRKKPLLRQEGPPRPEGTVQLAFWNLQNWFQR